MKGVRPVKNTERWGAVVVICLERGAELHIAQLMPLPLTVSCFSKIQIGFTFLVPAHPGGPGKRAVKRGCVCVCGAALLTVIIIVRANAWEDFFITLHSSGVDCQERLLVEKSAAIIRTDSHSVSAVKRGCNFKNCHQSK